MNVTALSNSANEAMETAAQTRAEAASGDTQATRKLARLGKPQAEQTMPAGAAAPASQAPAPSAPPPGTGVVLNAKA